MSIATGLYLEILIPFSHQFARFACNLFFSFLGSFASAVYQICSNYKLPFATYQLQTRAPILNQTTVSIAGSTSPNSDAPSPHTSAETDPSYKSDRVPEMVQDLRPLRTEDDLRNPPVLFPDLRFIFQESFLWLAKNAQIHIHQDCGIGIAADLMRFRRHDQPVDFINEIRR